MVTCVECGQRARWNGETSRTLVCFRSPAGHDHDDNCRTRSYVCPLEHFTYVVRRNRCSAPGCDWHGRTDCFCHHFPLSESERARTVAVCFAGSRCVTAPLPHHHPDVGRSVDVHAGLTCADCIEREKRIPFVDEWPA